MLGVRLGLDLRDLFIFVSQLPLEATNCQRLQLKLTRVVVLQLFAFFARRLHCLLLLTHLLHLSLHAMLKDLDLVLEGENSLVLTLESHLKRHHFVLNVVTLGLKRVNDVRPRLLDLVLQADNLLLQQEALLAGLLCSLVSLDELLLDLGELLRHLYKVFFRLLGLKQSLFHVSIGMS